MRVDLSAEGTITISQHVHTISRAEDHILTHAVDTFRPGGIFLRLVHDFFLSQLLNMQELPLCHPITLSYRICVLCATVEASGALVSISLVRTCMEKRCHC